MSETLASVVPSPRHDLLTVAALGLVAYALANPLHEGLGHGGACLLVGGKPLVLSSMHFDGDTKGLPRGANRLIAAGGTLVNLLVGGIALAALLRSRILPAQVRYFLWLFAFVNLFQGTGYFLFSGVAGIGDWASVIAGWPMPWLWRLVMAVMGSSHDSGSLPTRHHTSEECESARTGGARFVRACSCEADARPEYGNEHHRHDRGRCDPPPTASDGDRLSARRCEVGVEEELRAPQETAGPTQ